MNHLPGIQGISLVGKGWVPNSQCPIGYGRGWVSNDRGPIAEGQSLPADGQGFLAGSQPRAVKPRSGQCVNSPERSQVRRDRPWTVPANPFARVSSRRASALQPPHNRGQLSVVFGLLPWLARLFFVSASRCLPHSNLGRLPRVNRRRHSLGRWLVFHGGIS